MPYFIDLPRSRRHRSAEDLHIYYKGPVYVESPEHRRRDRHSSISMGHPSGRRHDRRSPTPLNRSDCLCKCMDPGCPDPSHIGQRRRYYESLRSQSIRSEISTTAIRAPSPASHHESHSSKTHSKDTREYVRPPPVYIYPHQSHTTSHRYEQTSYLNVPSSNHYRPVSAHPVQTSYSWSFQANYGWNTPMDHKPKKLLKRRQRDI